MILLYSTIAIILIGLLKSTHTYLPVLRLDPSVRGISLFDLKGETYDMILHKHYADVGSTEVLLFLSAPHVGIATADHLFSSHWQTRPHLTQHGNLFDLHV